MTAGDEDPPNDPNDGAKDDDGAGKEPGKDSIKRFVLRTTAPFRLETDHLGPILSRRLTVKGNAAFEKRMKSLEGVTDQEIVRAYMGSVSGIPLEDDEKLPSPLSDEQVAKLTDDDVQRFARAYLEQIVKPERIDEVPLSQLADFIRAERQQYEDAKRKLAETIASSLKIGSTAEYMKQWQAINRNVTGPIERLREEMQRVLGPLGSMKASIADTLKQMDSERDLAAKALASINDRNFASASKIDAAPMLHIPRLPPISETPVGRTAKAVEELGQLGKRMEGAMGLVLEQAGNVSEKMGQVLTKIESEAGKSQRAARIALTIGAISLAVSAIALGASAYFSIAGFRADRKDAIASDNTANQMVQSMNTQTTLLGDLVAETRKRSLPPPSAASSASTSTATTSSATGSEAPKSKSDRN